MSFGASKSERKAAFVAVHGQRHSSDRSDAIAILERIVEELSNRIAVLEAGLNGVVAPLIKVFGLTPTEAQILAFLLKRGTTSKESMQMVIYGLSDNPSVKSLDVALHKLRRKMGEFQVIISTGGHQCLTINPHMKNRVTQLMVSDGQQAVKEK